ncbi:hypothetical protein HD597_004149 [Nonomuraea thailandensis]|uniref:Uncharacterized protein n=1 Tax=Nonomuraea thailandensis TaxID=1188745 RepID=A0A9X2K286_9ACTN|nr:hypothetical protein [Nonomuraea thailandensis]MCP2357129.1 hypothetical protein [Nonomuraea thailandensis]
MALPAARMTTGTPFDVLPRSGRKRVLEINQLTTVTKEVVEAARENLIIGVM